jgi:hypothetical protein
VPEPTEAERIKSPDEKRWAEYNARMADLFAERNKHPVQSAERSAVAERILALWAAEG